MWTSHWVSAAVPARCFALSSGGGRATVPAAEGRPAGGVRSPVGGRRPRVLSWPRTRAWRALHASRSARFDASRPPLHPFPSVSLTLHTDDLRLPMEKKPGGLAHAHTVCLALLKTSVSHREGDVFVYRKPRPWVKAGLYSLKI